MLIKEKADDALVWYIGLHSTTKPPRLQIFYLMAHACNPPLDTSRLYGFI